MTIQDRIYLRSCYKSILDGTDDCISPYSIIDWKEEMSPIEFETWKVIKSIGLRFKPEFPVSKYFIDFANTEHKIGIECDGAMYHTDKSKDIIRDIELYKLGWKIFRITGRECNKIPELSLSEILYNEQRHNEEISDLLEDFFMNSVDGVVEAIDIFYLGGLPGFKHMDYVIKTLDAHRIINFPIEQD